jgi:hypothetical protein
MYRPLLLQLFLKLSTDVEEDLLDILAFELEALLHFNPTSHLRLLLGVVQVLLLVVEKERLVRDGFV